MCSSCRILWRRAFFLLFTGCKRYQHKMCWWTQNTWCFNIRDFLIMCSTLFTTFGLYLWLVLWPAIAGFCSHTKNWKFLKPLIKLYFISFGSGILEISQDDAIIILYICGDLSNITGQYIYFKKTFTAKSGKRFNSFFSLRRATWRLPPSLRLRRSFDWFYSYETHRDTLYKCSPKQKSACL